MNSSNPPLLSVEGSQRQRYAPFYMGKRHSPFSKSNASGFYITGFDPDMDDEK